MKKKNILICGIRDFDKHDQGRFFVCKDDNRLQICDGLISGVGEAKKILSSVPIDEIIAIGSTKQTSSAIHDKISVGDGSEFLLADVSNLSEFEYFRYRLAQFVNNIDIEQADFFNSINEEKRNELIAKLKQILGEDLKHAFASIISIEGIRDNLNKLFDTLDEKEIDWCMRYLYSVLDDSYKMHPLTQNKDIPISFVPISNSGSYEEVTQFHKLIGELLYVPDTESNLYVDMHSFSIETSFVCLNTLFTLSDDVNTPIYIRGITNAKQTSFLGIEEISLQERRYRTEKLMNGIRAFLDNGKTDILVEYWNEAKEDDPTIKNEYIDKILYSMIHVDAGISLCNISELEKGVFNLKKTLNHPEMYQKEMSEAESLMIMMIKKSIAKDFGSLMEGDELDTFELVKWAYKKKFYQQVVTLIESQIPTYMVDKGIIYPCINDEEKEKYFVALNAHYYDIDGKDRWWFNNVKHYFIKSYGRFAIDYRNKAIDSGTQYTTIRTDSVFGNSMEKNILPAHSLIDDREILYNVLYSYYTLSYFRNHLCHAESGNDDEELSGVSKMWLEAGNVISSFIDSLDKAIENIGDKKVEKEMFTFDELNAYFRSHGPRDIKLEKNVPGYTPSFVPNKNNNFHKPFNKKPYNKTNNIHFDEDQVHISINIPKNNLEGKDGFVFNFKYKDGENND